MNQATSFGGPFVLMPKRLLDKWVESMGGVPDPEIGLYGEVCSEQSLMHVIRFEGAEIVRLAEEPSDLFWLPSELGGIVVQWMGADSAEQLLAYGEKIADEAKWDEELEFEVKESDLVLMDSCGFEGDGQPKIEISLSAGSYKIEAVYSESETVADTVFRIRKKE